MRSWSSRPSGFTRPTSRLVMVSRRLGIGASGCAGGLIALAAAYAVVLPSNNSSATVRFMFPPMSSVVSLSFVAAMAELRPIPFDQLLRRMLVEPARQQTLFDLPLRKAWRPRPGCDLSVAVRGHRA